MDKIGIKLEKPFCLYKPDDFRTFPNATLIYSGELNSFYNNIRFSAHARKKSNMPLT